MLRPSRCASLIILLSLLVASIPLAAQQKKKSSNAARVARGKYLATIAACHDCHTPKVDAQMTPDMSRAFSGRPITTPPPKQREGEITASMDLTAWAGPWGNSFAANLTPDAETGLGKRYDEAKFIKAIRTGKKPEGEPLLPPMPWNVYSQMTDEDLKSLWAYLKTVPAVKNNPRAAAPAPAGATK